MKIYYLTILISLLVITTFGSEGLTVNKNNLLQDSNGNVKIYHGVNVVYKPYPYYPKYDGDWNHSDSFNEQDIQYLVQWGFNHIRLYIAWEGVQPQQEKFDQKYIDNIKNIVSMCETAGISVLLDFHQDLYSNYFCGEGLPRWIVDKVMPQKQQNFPKPLNIELNKDKEGYPELDDCHKEPFFKYYFSQDVNTVSQDLITNVNKLTDYMGRFWGYVAQEFKDSSNVLGYELINEPWGVSIYDHPISELLPGNQNNNYLLPFYQALNQQIRAVDRNSLVFYEPITWDFINSGFEENVGGPQFQNKEVLSYHIYCPYVDDEGQPIIPLFCKLWDNYQSNGKEANYKQMGVAGWLSEFGALGDTQEDANELDNILGNADKIFNSWSYWQYKYFNDITTAAANPDTEGFWNEKGELQKTKVSALARSYAYKICGNPEKMTWNRKTQKFKLTVQLNRSVCKNTQKTEIYLSEQFFYQNGFNATFTNCDDCKLEQLDNKGYYKVTGDEKLEDQSSWTLQVSPK